MMDEYKYTIEQINHMTMPQILLMSQKRNKRIKALNERDQKGKNKTDKNGMELQGTSETPNFSLADLNTFRMGYTRITQGNKKNEM